MRPQSPTTGQPPAGFTLVEAIIALAVIGLLGGLAIPVFSSLQVGNDLDIASTAVAQSLRRAQVLAQGVDGDRRWGVRVEAGQVVLFRGPSFAARDAGFDERFELAANLTVSGLQEVAFTRVTGLPLASGATTVTSSTGEFRTITINGKGMVAY